MKRKLKVNDFFCGCGGMSIAFKNAGYEIAGHGTLINTPWRATGQT